MSGTELSHVTPNVETATDAPEPVRVHAVPSTLIVPLGLYALIGGFLSVLGWMADVPRLTDWFGLGISIQPNAAIAAMMSGAALLAVSLGYRLVASVIGLVVMFIGATALIQWLLPIEFRSLNTFLMFGREWGQRGVIDPGRMGPPGSICWTLIGTAFVLLGVPGRTLRRTIPRIGVITLGIGTLSLAGYLYEADRLFSLPYVTVIALQTATLIVAVSAGVVAAVPDCAPTRWLLDRGATGTVARLAVPLIIIIPFVAGWLEHYGELHGWYDGNFGTAMLVLVLIALLLVLLAWMLRIVSASETALRETERRVSNALESITDGFVTIGPDWRYRFINTEGARILQKAPGELVGRHVAEVFPEFLTSPAREKLQHALESRTTSSFEHWDPVFQRWYSNRVYPTNDGSVTIYFQDITARREAEAERAADLAGVTRLQSLSTKLVQSGDLTSLLQEIVAGAADLTGTNKASIQVYDPEAGVLRTIVQQGVGPEFLERFAKSGAALGCHEAVRTLARVEVPDIVLEPAWQGSEDQRVLLADGIRAFQSTPLISRSGNLLGVLNTHFPEPRRLNDRERRHLDLLARMAADFMERSQSEESMKQADRLKDEFLAMLAHELRNPMAPIVNAVQILRATRGEDDTVRSTTDMLQRQVSQLSRLTDDLVDVSRITRGKIELERQRVDIHAVVNQAVEAARPLIDGKLQQLDMRLPPAPVFVDGDFTRLAQVVGNLLSNASKFSSRNAHLELDVVVNGDTVAIHVRDDGVGISPDDLPRIFDLFMQGDRSLERSTSGLGIGLTLVRTLVEMHGGTVEARSDGPEQGSEFIVRLPTTEQDVPAVAEPVVNESSHRSHRVLIVDDNEDGAASLANVLMLAGHVTLIAHDGMEAISIANQFRPDVILLDIGLPKLNGYETCKRIREQSWGKAITLVALTGWGQESFRVQSSTAGFDQHLVKPVDAETVLALVNSDVHR